MITFKDRITNILTNQKSVSLRFLSLEEQMQLQNIKEVTLDGGFAEAEKKRAYFFGNQEDNIISYKIIYNKKHLKLSHQNILGTLLSLGITTDSIGDILPRQDAFICTKEIRKEIEHSFTIINNVPIELQVVDSKELHHEKELLDDQTTLDSLRLDLVISKITKLSRNKALELIQKEFVKVNHKKTTKHTIVLKETDVLSIRKYGRYILNDTQKRSKKGKIVLKYAKYI